MKSSSLEQNTPAWRLQVWASFGLAFGTTLMGIFFLPVDMWTKGFMLMGTLFTVGSTFTLSKTVRDDHEAAKLIRRMDNARTEKLLSEFGEG